MNTPVTLKDIARKLNISVSTVSRALKDLPDVNPETKKAVSALAEELNYQPNYIAQALVKKNTKTLGVIVPSIYSNYFSEALSAMTDIAIHQDYYLMICQSNENAELEKKCVRKLMACHVDGLLISVSKETKDSKIFETVRNSGMPIVMFDRILEDFECSKVIVDEYLGALKAVTHLIQKGCRRIAHLAGPKNLSVSYNREKGYLDALKKHNLPIEKSLICYTQNFEEDSMKALKKLMQGPKKPDGIFFVNDLSAISGIKYLIKKGYSIPKDIKIVGFNNDFVSQVVAPSLTTVMQPGYEVGKLAIGILMDEIKDKKEIPVYRTTVLRSNLVVRESSR